MSKVKITEEQASEIELRKQSFSNESTIKKHLEGWEAIRVLNSLTLDELIRALYIGYEVEPEFKVGDIVKDGNDTLREVAEVKENGIYLYVNNEIKSLGWHGKKTDMYKPLRHATDVEVESYKKRRFWHENDREVWELKEGDMLNINDSYESIKEIYEGEYIFESGITEEVNNFNKLIEIGNVEIICFAHDRKDLKND